MQHDIIGTVSSDESPPRTVSSEDSLPRMVMYAELNNSFSYLPRLKENGVELAEIPYSGHFPMHSNPPEMYRRIARFLSS